MHIMQLPWDLKVVERGMWLSPLILSVDLMVGHYLQFPQHDIPHLCDKDAK